MVQYKVHEFALMFEDEQNAVKDFEIENYIRSLKNIYYNWISR